MADRVENPLGDDDEAVAAPPTTDDDDASDLVASPSYQSMIGPWFSAPDGKPTPLAQVAYFNTTVFPTLFLFFGASSPGL